MLTPEIVGVAGYQLAVVILDELDSLQPGTRARLRDRAISLFTDQDSKTEEVKALLRRIPG